jgi:hypothetical protein
MRAQHFRLIYSWRPVGFPYALIACEGFANNGEPTPEIDPMDLEIIDRARREILLLINLQSSIRLRNSRGRVVV